MSRVHQQNWLQPILLQSTTPRRRFWPNPCSFGGRRYDSAWWNGIFGGPGFESGCWQAFFGHLIFPLK